MVIFYYKFYTLCTSNSFDVFSFLYKSKCKVFIDNNKKVDTHTQNARPHSTDTDTYTSLSTQMNLSRIDMSGDAK